jgi:hypothetical protein
VASILALWESDSKFKADVAAAFRIFRKRRE